MGTVDRLAPVVLDRTPTDARELVRAADGAGVRIGQDALADVAAAHETVLAVVRSGTPAYGVTTGLGPARDQAVPAELVADFQEQILATHAAAVGPWLPRRGVRAVIVARLATLRLGGAGASTGLVRGLAALLDRDVLPAVPALGSVGSADLVQLAAVGQVLLGHGFTLGPAGEPVPAADALARAGLDPVRLEAKDALALIGTNAAAVGLGALAWHDAEALVAAADHVAGATAVALRANPGAFAERVVAARPLPGQLASARRLRAAIDPPGPPRSVQDPLSLRTVPQVHGAVLDELGRTRRVLDVELNARPENPLVDAERGTVTSNGNFSALALALAFESVRLGLAHIGMLAERRIHLLVREARSARTVAEQIRDGEWRARYVAPLLFQDTAASLAARLKQLAAPVSLLGTPVADGVEDHNALALPAGQLTEDALAQLRSLLAVEALLAADRLRPAGPAADTVPGRIVAIADGAVARSATHAMSDGIVADLAGRLTDLDPDGGPA